MDIKLKIAVIGMVLAPALIGYATGFNSKHGLSHAVTWWAVFVVMFTVGILLAWFTKE